MSTEDLTTSSRPTQSGKVVQLNGECTSQITLPMSQSHCQCGEEVKQAKHYIRHISQFVSETKQLSPLDDEPNCNVCQRWSSPS